MGKWSKTCRMGETWDINIHTTFPKVWLFLFHQILTLWHFTSHEKWMGCPINFFNTGKSSKICPMGRTWNIDNHTFPRVWLILFHRISTLWYSTSHEKCMDFSINFFSMGKCSKIHHIGRTWYIDTHIFSQIMGNSVPANSHRMVISHYMGGTWVFSQVSRSMGEFGKTHLWCGNNLEHWYPYFLKILVISLLASSRLTGLS